MAVELATAYVSIIPSARGIQGQIDKELSGVPTAAGRVGKDAGAKMGGGLKAGLLSKVGGVGGLLAAAGIGALVKGSIDAASDLNESASKVGVVFGKQSDQVVKASKSSATAMGLSSQAYLEATGTLGNLLVSLDIAPQKAADLSQQMVKLAGDLASFNNVSPEEALLAIKSGLTGETEPLKRFGVNMNDATLHAEALKLGLISTVKDALTPQAKALAAQSLIMAQTTTAQGDFARTSGGLANQQRILAAQFEDVKAKLGTALLPAFVAVAGFLTGTVIPVLTSVGHFVKDNATAFKILAGVVAGVWLAFKGYQAARAAGAALAGFSAKYRQYVAQLSYGNKAQQAASSGLQSISVSSLKTKGALAAVAIATAALTKHWLDAKKRQAELKAVTEEYNGVLRESKGAIDDAVVSTVTQKLASDGAYNAAIKYGISQSLVTQAALGNKDAIDQLTKATEGNVGAMKNVLSPTLEQAFGLKTAAEQYRQSTAQTNANTTATKTNNTERQKAKTGWEGATKAASEAAKAAKEHTRQMQFEGDAAGLLKQALDTLNGKTLDVNDANVQFHSQLLSVISALKENGSTLDLNTEAGIANNQAISGAIRAAQAHAEAVSGGTDLTKAGTDAYRADLIALRDRIKAVGGNTTEIQKMIDKMGQIPPVKKTKIELDAEQAKADAAALAAYYKATLGSVTTYAQIASNVFQAGTQGTAGVFGHNAQGTDYWRGGPTWVGEQGRELVNLPRGAQVMDNRRSEKFAAGRGDVNLTLNSYNTLPQPEYVSAAAVLRAGAAELGRT